MEREAMKKRTKAKIELIVSFINLILIIFLIFLRNGDIKVQRVWGVSLGEPYCNPCFIINTNIGEPKSGDLIIYKDGEKDSINTVSGMDLSYDLTPSTNIAGEDRKSVV